MRGSISGYGDGGDAPRSEACKGGGERHREGGAVGPRTDGGLKRVAGMEGAERLRKRFEDGCASGRGGGLEARGEDGGEARVHLRQHLRFFGRQIDFDGGRVGIEVRALAAAEAVVVEIEGLSFELLNRNVDQPYKYNATWVIDEWSKIGLQVKQRVLPTGPWFEALRNGAFDVGVTGNCQSVVNPVLDVARYLPGSIYAANYANFEDPQAVELYNKMLRETDFAKQRSLMREFEKHVLDTEAHDIFLLWWYRMVPHRSYVKGWKISPAITSTRIWRQCG